MNKEELYDRAYELFEQKHYSQAIDILISLHEKHPEDTDILSLLASCYVKIYHFTDAAKALMHADRIEPCNAEIKYNLGYALLCLGRLNDAMNYFKESLMLNPPKKVRKMINNMVKSKADFEAKLENNYDIPLEDEFECYELFIEAQRCLYSGKPEEAIKIYEKILSKKPNHSNTISNIGAAYIKMKEPEKALPWLEKALSLSPKDDITLSNLAYAHFLLKNNEKSSRYVEELMKIIKDPPLRDLMRILSALIEMKQYRHARKLINSYRGGHPQITFFSGVLYAIEKDYANAQTEFSNVKGAEIAKRYYELVCRILTGEIKDFKFELKTIGADIELQ